MIKDALCRAFCEALTVAEVPIGYAVKTAFEAEGGDALTFYLVRNVDTNMWRIEDDGATVGNLALAGIDVMGSGPRAVAFADLIQEHNVRLDSAEVLLHTDYVIDKMLPTLALRFLSLLLRVQDFALITRDRVEDTFRHDVFTAIQEKFSDRARIEERYTFREDLADYQSDIAILPPHRPPMAVFLGTSEVRALEAMLFYDRVKYVRPYNCLVVLILDTVKTPKISARTLNRVTNHFPIAAFRNEPQEAMESLARQLYGEVSEE